MILYVDDILLASNCSSLLDDTKSFLQSNFEMKDLGKASYFLGLSSKQIEKGECWDCLKSVIQKKVLKRFIMTSCGTTEMPISRGDKLNKSQCPKSAIEKDNMKEIPYASLMGSLICASLYKGKSYIHNQCPWKFSIQCR